MQGWLILIIAVAYVSLLFAIARLGDRRSARFGDGRLRPYVYGLSLAIYCTSWTFFGSVGVASRHGIEFLAIYVGPFLVFVFGTPLIRRIVRLAKSEKITSVVDFLAARYGRSFAVAAIATLIAAVGTVPYIALQLKAVSDSVSLMVHHYNGAADGADTAASDFSFIVAVLLALFAVLFGTRHADATERQDGLVLAIAVELVVKLAALAAVGIAVTFFFFEGPSHLLASVRENTQVAAAMQHSTPLSSWIVAVALSGFAVLMLPRQFYMSVVQSRGEAELGKAGWLFPLYLVLINVFVVPIAFAGLAEVGGKTSADLYVVSLPLSQGSDAMAMVALIGGLSAATAMVIVATVALSIMVSNDLVIPLFVRRGLAPDRAGNEDWTKRVLLVRRAAICLIMLAALLYHREIADDTHQALIGLISFAAIAQFAPAMLGGLVWRRANARGAVLGMGIGIAVWAYTLLLPSLAPGADLVAHGLFGLEALRPQALLGTGGDPLNHGVLWSLSLNMLFYVLGSLSRASEPLERIQAAIFVPREASQIPALRRFRALVTVDELRDTVARYVGEERTERSLERFEAESGVRLDGNQPASTALVRFAEQLLASTLGSSSARLVLSLLFQRYEFTPRRTQRLLGDASQALQQNRDLLQTALDQMEQGITVFDRDLQLTWWNRQFRELLGLPDRLGQVGVSAVQVLHYLVERDDIAADDEHFMLDRLAATGRIWQMELLTSGRIIEIRSNPMPDGGIVVTYADITRRVAADQALKRANETLEQRVASRTVELTRVNEELARARKAAEEANLGKTHFLAAAGHDILQPLNAARLHCSSLAGTLDSERAVETLGSIESSLDAVEAILGAVLDISRLDTGALKPAESVFRLEDLLKQIETDFQLQARKKGLDLRIVPSSLWVRTDPNLLRRLVQNLVSNAVKYTRRGTVLVGVRRRRDALELQVLDSGIGIAADKLGTVFREFIRLEEGAREASGLGLGLSIVDRIARVLGIEIKVRSTRGRGTCFSVLLPRSAPADIAASAESRPAAKAGLSLDGMTVLCVDNDKRILESMHLLLRGWGCTVKALPGTRNFVAGAAAFRPDVVLVDYHLDDENGLEAIARLRSAYGADLPALLVTADRSDDLRRSAERLDISVVNKPVRPAMLRAALARYRRIAAAAE